MSLIDLGEPFRLVDVGSLVELPSPSVFDLGKARLEYGNKIIAESVIHIGLGDTTVVNQMKIHWPAGASEIFKSIDVNQRYLVIEGSSELEAID